MLNLFDRFCLQNSFDLKASSKLRELLIAKKRDWSDFLQILSLFLGGGLFAFGVVFFIAANWESLGKFFKFFIVEVIMFGGVFAWYFLKNPLFKKVALMVSFITLGALLALIGQVYQTGANSWELFFYWAILGIFWVVADRFEPLWLLWIAVVNLSAFLYFNFFSFYFLYLSNYYLIIFLNLSLFAIFETLDRLKIYPTLLVRRVLITIVVVSMTLSAIEAIFNFRVHFDIYPLLFTLLVAYFYTKKDHYSISILALSFDVVVLSFIAKHLFKLRGIDIIFAFFVMSVISITLALFTIKIVKSITKGESDDL